MKKPFYQTVLITMLFFVMIGTTMAAHANTNTTNINKTIDSPLEIQITSGIKTATHKSDGIPITITNTGETDINNISWSISLTPIIGTLREGNYSEGTINVLPANGFAKREGKPLYGFCISRITATANSPDTGETIDRAMGIIISRSIIILPTIDI